MAVRPSPHPPRQPGECSGTNVAAAAHHAAVEVLVHLAEGVRRRLALGRHDDADVGDGQRGVRLALGGGAAVRDVDALRRRAADVGRPAVGRGLDEVAARLQTLLPLVQHPGDAHTDTHTDTHRHTWRGSVSVRPQPSPARSAQLSL